MNIIPGPQRMLEEAHQEISKQGETEGVMQLRVPWLPKDAPVNQPPQVIVPIDPS